MSDLPTEDEILGALRQVKDPEIGVSIVDLGLIYGIDVIDNGAKITMTMTSPGCPLAGLLEQEARAALRNAFPGIHSVSVEMVWEPPWSPIMMSWEAQQQLGWAK